MIILHGVIAMEHLESILRKQLKDIMELRKLLKFILQIKTLR